MPILIAHRGNVEGPSPEYENKPNYVFGCLRAYDNIHVEIDVWRVDGELLLGHDSPQYSINDAFLVDARLWCHAKNLDAFEHMLNNPLVHCFWHQEDDFTLTSRGYIWTYPDMPLCEKSICVQPEEDIKLPPVAGICSDFIGKYGEV